MAENGKEIITQISSKEIGIEDFKNISGHVDGKSLNLEDAMTMLYNLANSIIISDTEPRAPKNGRGLWLDTTA